MIEEELARLQTRLDELRLRIIPDQDSRSQQIYSEVMSLPKDSEKRLKLEKEYAIVAKELGMRNDEARNISQQMENLEFEKKISSR